MMLTSFLSQTGSLRRKLYFKCTTVISLIRYFSVTISISEKNINKNKAVVFSVIYIPLFLAALHNLSDREATLL